MSTAAERRFAPGTPVRIRADAHLGHHRTPLYLKGRRGVVDHFITEDPNPEQLAFGQYHVPPIPVYAVRFVQRELWPDYRGSASDTLVADFFEHWLEPTD